MSRFSANDNDLKEFSVTYLVMDTKGDQIMSLLQLSFLLVAYT